MNEPIFYVGQKVAVLSITPCCKKITVIPETEVIDISYCDHLFFGCAECRNFPVGTYSGFAYVVAGREKIFFMEKTLRPIDQQFEYHETERQQELAE